MITAFRIHGQAQTKEALENDLQEATGAILRSLDQEGDWECTEEVIVRKSAGYEGRMKFLFDPRSS